jgi:hypothetical protein
LKSIKQPSLSWANWSIRMQREMNLKIRLWQWMQRRRSMPRKSSQSTTASSSASTTSPTCRTMDHYSNSMRKRSRTGSRATITAH